MRVRLFGLCCFFVIGCESTAPANEDAAQRSVDGGATDAEPLPSPVSVDCPTSSTSVAIGSAPSVESTIGPAIRRSLRGTNGTFVDSCDDSGNLVDYECETKQVCDGPWPNPTCTSEYTGNVIPQTYDCNGHCHDGACVARCPAPGDVLTYAAVDTFTGSVTFLNRRERLTYPCKLEFDVPDDSYDCKLDPMMGSAVHVVWQWLRTGYCTGGDFGTFGVDAVRASSLDAGATESTCTYSCTLP